jgi:hypothetical protein
VLLTHRSALLPDRLASLLPRLNLLLGRHNGDLTPTPSASQFAVTKEVHRAPP